MVVLKMGELMVRSQVEPEAMELSLMAVPSVARPVPVQPFVSVLLPIVLRTVRVVMVVMVILVTQLILFPVVTVAMRQWQAVVGFIVILPAPR